MVEPAPERGVDPEPRLVTHKITPVENTPAERRAVYRDRLAELAEAYPELSGPDLARKLAAELDRKEAQTLAEDYLSGLAVSGILANQYRYMVSRDRHALLKSVDVLKREPPQSDEDRLSVFDRVPTWKEYAPGSGQRPVLDMTRDQLQAAIDFRMKGIGTDIWICESMRRIHAGMEGLAPNRPASDRYTDDQVADLLMTTRREMKSGQLRFRYDLDSIPSLPGATGNPRQNRRRNPAK